MEALTDRLVKATPAPKAGRSIIFDSHKDAPPGFGLRVSPASKRTFVLRYNADGRDRMLTIGEYGTWTLTAARKKAAALRRRVDGGSDILRERRMKRVAGSVADVVERWCSEYADSLKSGSEVRRILTQHLVPTLGDVKIKDASRADFFGVVSALASRTPRQAALLLTYAKQLMKYAENRELIPYSPIASLKPADINHAMKSNPRKRVLTDDEMRSLWHAQSLGMDRATLLALKFILATGQRPGEVCRASGDEIHGNVWTIPAAHRGKTNDDHDVPLTATALDLIRQAGGKRYLFEAHQGRMMQPSALGHALRRCAGDLRMPAGNRWRPHDLRRTARTGLAAAGVPEVVAELTVGHVRKGIAAVYDQHRYGAEIRAALEAWEVRLLATVTPEPDGSGNVVPMARRKA